MGIYYTINFSADRSASAGNIAPGLCVCFTSDGNTLTVATTAALGGRAVLGIVVRNPQSNLVTFQSVGACDRTITGIPFLAGATKLPLRVNAVGALERADPVNAGDIIVGTCNEWGDALLNFAQATSAIVGTLAGDVTGSISDNRVTTLRGNVFTGAVYVPSGSQLLFPGGALFSTGNKLEWKLGDGLYVHPNLNVASFFGAVSPTQAGIWYTAANALTPTSSNYAVLYDSAADVVRLRGASVNVVGDGVLVSPPVNVPVYVGAVDSTTAGIWIGSNTAAPSTSNYQVLLSAGGVTLRGAFIGINADSIMFASTAITPQLSQDPIVGTPNPIAVTAQSSYTSGTAGGQAQISGGQGNVAADGGAYLAAGYTPMVEVADLYSGAHRYITALNLRAGVTTTNMPTGTGGGVTFVANCATTPTGGVAPVNGTIFFSSGGNLYMQGSDGWQVAL